MRKKNAALILFFLGVYAKAEVEPVCTRVAPAGNPPTATQFANIASMELVFRTAGVDGYTCDEIASIRSTYDQMHRTSYETVNPNLVPVYVMINENVSTSANSPFAQCDDDFKIRIENLKASCDQVASPFPGAPGTPVEGPIPTLPIDPPEATQPLRGRHRDTPAYRYDSGSRGRIQRNEN